MSRSLNKGPYVAACLMGKIQAVKDTGKREVVKTWKRASMVLPEMVGLTLAIHDGRRFISVFVTENMVGHKLGEFVPTRTFRIHSGQRKAGLEGEAAPTAAAPGAPGAPVSATPGVATPATAPAPEKKSASEKK